MQSIFLLDAVIPGRTNAQYMQTCSEPVYIELLIDTDGSEHPGP